MTGRWISMHDFLRALEGEAADYFAADGREKELSSRGAAYASVEMFRAPWGEESPHPDTRGSARSRWHDSPALVRAFGLFWKADGTRRPW